MHYFAAAETDIGLVKESNQDSFLIEHAESAKGEVLMAVICDGMGGLEKGEVASAAVINSFSYWFHEELPYELHDVDMAVIGGKWELMLKELNISISEYGKKNGVTLGTTFTGLLCIGEQYMLGHVGDTRLYKINESLQQLTEDHTLVAREIKQGKISPEQAKGDKRRNILLQCVGASKIVTPQIKYGKIDPGIYLICSDGFRNMLDKEYIHRTFNQMEIKNKEEMHERLREVIGIVKAKGEQDNISAILIKAGEVV